jgi:primary-amine oxidase
VAEVDLKAHALDPVTNPAGNAFGPVETVLKTEQEAIRTCNQGTARHWKIKNTGTANGVNRQEPAYKLIPFTKGPAQPTLLTHPTSVVSQKGAFATAHLWVTPYTPTERFPAGEYAPQSHGGALQTGQTGVSQGLADWVQANRSIENTNVVLWHAFGVTHVPRTEDFPVMPCEVTGFTLKPDNFFAGNPAIDLPPDYNAASRSNDSTTCCDNI